MLRKIASTIKGFFKKSSSKSFAPTSGNTNKTVVPRKTYPHKEEKDRTTKNQRFNKYGKRSHRTFSKNSQEKNQSERPEQPKETPPQPAWDSSAFKVPVVDGKVRFHDLHLAPEILHAISDLKFSYCTPVQAETLVKSLIGEDIMAQAQTGTGKTAAYLITIFSHLLKHPATDRKQKGTPRAVILAPTRELVMQIERDARKLGAFITCSIVSVFGGMDYRKQQSILQHETVDVLIGTPGRMIDFKQKHLIDLSKVEILVLDEADRMLDMGFIQAVRSLVQSTPPKAKRQTMFYSATMSSDVKRLAEQWTKQANDVSIMPETIAVETVEQITYITTYHEKQTLVYNLIKQKDLHRVLMFVNRRDEARHIKELLDQYGVRCTLLSGDVDQRQRIQRLERFREGNVRVLVATDVASRGLHIEGITHVINYNMPQDPEEYVHRIGRTGRAGASGIAINFADEDDSYELLKLEEYLGKRIHCIYPEDSLMTPIPPKSNQNPSKHNSHHQSENDSSLIP